MALACRILHVDDDPEIRVIVDMSLRLDAGFSVTGASRLGDALEMLADTATPPPDALLLDYSVGGTNGPDLLKALRAVPRIASVPAIFLTAWMTQRMVADMVQAGARGVLAKPFNPITLAREVRTLLHR